MWPGYHWIDIAMGVPRGEAKRADWREPESRLNLVPMKRMPVEVWSDIACPWCYVGKRRLEAALQRLPFRDSVDVVWRAFELDPSAPPLRDPAVPYAQRLAQKYRRSTAEAEKMVQSMTEVGKADGLDLRFDRVKSGNTFDAHRVIHLAGERGVQDAIKERLLRAYMTEGEPISDHAVLERLAVEVGLSAAETRSVLASDKYAAEVRADEAEARAIGISGVPFFAIARRYGIPGAQPTELLVEALSQAWEELGEEGVSGGAVEERAVGDVVEEGAACGPEGCD
jgi:predicted DsbA family dithiol-disulfide isomerase